MHTFPNRVVNEECKSSGMESMDWLVLLGFSSFSSEKMERCPTFMTLLHTDVVENCFLLIKT